MNYYEEKLIWDDVKLLALTFHDATRHKFSIKSYKYNLIREASSKYLDNKYRLNYIIKSSVREILDKLLKYNKRLLILMIMQVKEISYYKTLDTTIRFNIQDLTNLLLMIISNNSERFYVKYKYIKSNKKILKEFLNDIELIIELGYLIIYAINNQDTLFDCIDKYNISDIIEEMIYPSNYEEFYDNDYLKMENKKKPEEYKIKNQLLKEYIDKKQEKTKYFKEELDDIFNRQYEFPMSALKILFEQEEKTLKNTNIVSIQSYHNNLNKYYSIKEIEKIFQFLNCNKNKNFIYNKDNMHLMELNPVYIDDEELIYSQSHLIYTLSVLINLINSGDTQFAKYYDFNRKDLEKIEGHINTYMESYALGVIIELLLEYGYRVPKTNYKNEIIPIADVKKHNEFGLNKIDFDSDLFFADLKRKIIYNIDFKYSNSIVSFEFALKKAKNKIPKYINNLKERENVIVSNLEKVREILNIEDISEFSFKSALCMIRPNYYCYSNSKLWHDVYYTNWFRVIENLENKKELLE